MFKIERFPVRDTIIQLYPMANNKLPLKNLYLQHNMLERYAAKGSAYLYTNFITSLDGRIAIPHSSGKGLTVPKTIANPRDWRLFQELAVQADILITTGRYLREVLAGNPQKILQAYDDPQFADLKEWRLANGFQPIPDLAIVSFSLNFRIPEVLSQDDRTVHIVTTQDADSEAKESLQEDMGNIILAGEDQIDGQTMIDQLSDLGYRTIYSTAGPKVFHLLLSANVIDRLYLTYANRILGGDPFSSIVEGDLMESAVDFKLHSLYYDPSAPDNVGQLFSCYDRV
jgi:riboflavin biosynthesis pyrimidine reductase